MSSTVCATGNPAPTGGLRPGDVLSTPKCGCDCGCLAFQPGLPHCPVVEDRDDGLLIRFLREGCPRMREGGGEHFCRCPLRAALHRLMGI